MQLLSYLSGISAIYSPASHYKCKSVTFSGFSLRHFRFVYVLVCVTSVSVGFGSKERPSDGIFGVLSARKMGREPKKNKEGDGGGEGRKRLQTNPWILKTAHLAFHA